ncbi:MAG TPA: MopE-related protein, partial [Angustibacter sp.]|nr:MopE-related protein [Angustibacter sp.]
KTHIALTALFKYDKAKAIAACIMAPTPSCLKGVLKSIYGPKSPLKTVKGFIESSTLKLVANEAAHYGAIWHDPADTAFEQPTVVEPRDLVEPPTTGTATADALASTLAPMSDETQLTQALLHAIERYQGAEAAGDAAWSLTQARAVHDLSADLRRQLADDTTLQDLRDAVAADVDGVTASAKEGADVAERIRRSGFTADERRTLRNQGLSTADIAALEAGYVADGVNVAPTGEQVLAQLDAQLAARSAMADALTASVDGWATVVADLEQRTAAATPHASAGGPYTASAGTVALDASASTATTGHSLSSYAWDLDGDGQFDDATGATVAATVAGGPARTIGVKVTDDTGSWSVAYSRLTFSGDDRAPVVSDSSPARAASVTTGATQAFTVQASDPDGDTRHYAWTLDDSPVGTDSASWSYGPTSGDIGTHVLSVVVSGARRRTATSWVVVVTAPDADGDGWTATPDCDDSRADVHPGGFERLGNGIDDDCDPSTPDAPPGGLTGDVRSWGNAQGVGLPIGSTSVYYQPVAVPALTGVRQVDSMHAGGFAVMGDGTVKAWGQNYGGSLGNGTQTQSYVPVSVSGVGGGGQLSGVRTLAADNDHVVALRTDGSVVAWGAGENGQVGDGTFVAAHPYPLEVVDASGAPLTGATAVATGEQTSSAVDGDGRVWTWGVNACDGSATVTKTSVATLNPAFGTGVVQLETGDSGFTLARKADGSVWACGGDEVLLDRGSSLSGDAVATPAPMQHLGPGAGVVDVSASSWIGVALREDGTVWTWGRNVDGELDVLGLARGERL